MDDNSTQYGRSCWTGFVSSTGYVDLAGGTSASTPSFAGMLTLITQKYGPQGNINPTLYGFTSNLGLYETVFHDITIGSNIVNCVLNTSGCSGSGQMGWYATPGYDLATGLGSIDGNALYTALGYGSSRPATTVVVTGTPSAVTIGGTTNLTATVSSTTAGTPTGTVGFQVGNTILGSAPVVNGTTLFPVSVSAGSGFVAGSDTVTASYSGDTNFSASSGNTSMAITAAPTWLNNFPQTATLGGTISLSTQIWSQAGGYATGTVTFKLGSKTLGSAPVTNNSATLQNVALSAASGFVLGSNVIVEIYSGDSVFAGTTGTVSITLLSPTVTSLVVTPTSLTVGGSVQVTANVTSTTPGTITGVVNFQVDGGFVGAVPLSGGTASMASSTLPIGSDTVTAIYAGDANYGTSTGSATVTVLGVPTTIAVTATPNVLGNNGTATLTATLNPSTAPGYVTFSANGNQLASPALVNGTASWQVSTANPGLVRGANTITASYSGNSIYALSSATTTLAIPSYTLTASPLAATISAGAGATIALNLSPAAYSGTVTLAVTSSSSNITATKSASNRNPALPWKSGGFVVCAVLLGAPFGFRRKRAMAVLLTALAISLVGLLISCGGGGSSSPQTYSIIVTPTGSGTVTNAVPVTITVTVP
jgi:hypothetical protein